MILDDIFKINEDGKAIIELWATQIYVKIGSNKGIYRLYSDNKLDDIRKAIDYIKDQIDEKNK